MSIDENFTWISRVIRRETSERAGQALYSVLESVNTGKPKFRLVSLSVADPGLVIGVGQGRSRHRGIRCGDCGGVSHPHWWSGLCPLPTKFFRTKSDLP